MSEEQVPSAPVELLNGKPEMTSFTLGVKTLGTPLNNLNEVIIVEKKRNVNKGVSGIQCISSLMKAYHFVLFVFIEFGN
ncbi:MAG: hypothetical protein IE909_11965 [Campylobacterales bacterium]|nr:hypothetical protein [Campylobacterales bacterium]